MSKQSTLFDLDDIPKESKYKITERPDGFLVEGKDRNPVTVALGPAYFQVSYPTNGEPNQWSCGLYSYYSLSAKIAEGLMHFWERPEDKRDNDPHRVWTGVEEWARKQCAGAIGKRAHVQWQRLLTKADPTVRAVHRAVFAATLGGCNLATKEELYRHKWAVSDIINYRAAAIAAANIGDLVRTRRQNTIRNSQELRELEAMAAELRGLAEQYDLTNVLHVSVDTDRLNYSNFTRTQVDYTEAIGAMANWRGLFSPDGDPYRSLNRTLMNLPGGIPHGLLCALNRRYLERPITNRLELLTALFDRALWRDPEHVNHRIYEHATAGQIKTALRRVAEHTQNELSHRRARDIRFLALFLGDLPADHQGNLVGLADRSILWHRAEAERDVSKQIEALGGGDTKTAEPPIPLPDAPGIQFLATVEDVCREGHDMGHCIASYARRACQGQCYIFHAEHEDDSATVQMGPGGRVIQALGPRNRRNGAATWATRLLNQWGRAIPEGAEPIVHQLPPPGPDETPF